MAKTFSYQILKKKITFAFAIRCKVFQGEFLWLTPCLLTNRARVGHKTSATKPHLERL